MALPCFIFFIKKKISIIVTGHIVSLTFFFEIVCVILIKDNVII